MISLHPADIPRVAMSPEEHRLVYYPDEDSFLLADCVVSDAGAQRGLPARPSVLEVGTGSGAVLAAAARHLRTSVACGTDINPVACAVASRTLAEMAAGFPPEELPAVRVLAGDLFDPVGCERFDVVLFNPPYVPSETVCTRGLDAGLGGGRDGRDVINRFIDELDGHLATWEGPGVPREAHATAQSEPTPAPRSLAYMVCIAANNVPKIIARCSKRGLEALPIASKRLSSEELFVLRIWRRE